MNTNQQTLISHLSFLFTLRKTLELSSDAKTFLTNTLISEFSNRNRNVSDEIYNLVHLYHVLNNSKYDELSDIADYYLERAQTLYFLSKRKCIHMCLNDDIVNLLVKFKKE